MDIDKIHSIRYEKLKSLLRDKKLEALLITSTENIYYFSGFTGTFGEILFLPEKKYFITDSRYLEQANRQMVGFEIIKYEKKAYYKNILDILKKNGISGLAIESASISWDKYKEIKDNLKGIDINSIKNYLQNLRACKDEYEIEIIKEAVSLADDGFDHILKYIKPGISEMELSAEIEYYFRKNGATESSFQTIVASGARSSMPHGVASMKKLEKGDTITFDFGAEINNYCSDLTRTVFLGEPNPEIIKIYHIVLEAQLKAEKSIKDGMSSFRIDKIARDVIKKSGYGKQFGHGLGHGVGIEVHESPNLSPLSKDILKEGMIVTVEPGIYISGIGGVRIEDMLLVKKNGAEILTKSNKSIIII